MGETGREAERERERESGTRSNLALQLIIYVGRESHNSHNREAISVYYETSSITLPN